MTIDDETGQFLVPLGNLGEDFVCNTAGGFPC